MTRVMVDMSATIVHHGHIRLLRRAAELGQVIVALTTDEEVFRAKGFWPPLKYPERAEILQAVRYVDEVVPSPWLIDEAFLDRHRADLLVHGDDHSNPIDPGRVVILPRTSNVSSSAIRFAIAESTGGIHPS